VIGASERLLTGLTLVGLAIGSAAAGPDALADETDPAEPRIADDGLGWPGPGPLLAEGPDGAPLSDDPPQIGKRGRRRSPGRGGEDGFLPRGPGPGGRDMADRSRGPGRFHGRRRMPSADQIEEGMAFLKEHWSERYTMMAQLQDDDPEAFNLAFRNIWPQLSRLTELSYRNPELASVEAELIKLEYDILRRVRAYHRAAENAPDPGQPAQSDTPGPTTNRSAEGLEELEALVGERFDLQIKRSELRIQELADQLTQHRRRLETERQNKQAEVADMVRRLTSAKRFQKRPWSRWSGDRPERLLGVPGREDPLGPGRGRGARRPRKTTSLPAKPSE